MNKGLEALKEIKDDVVAEYIDDYKWHFETIEKELEEYQLHEEILNDYGLTLVNFREACLLLAMLKGEGRNIHDIDKQFKALEIIKEKKVDVYSIFMNKTYEEYIKNESIFINKNRLLTQEEFDFLKEVLL